MAVIAIGSGDGHKQWPVPKCTGKLRHYPKLLPGLAHHRLPRIFIYINMATSWYPSPGLDVINQQ